MRSRRTFFIKIFSVRLTSAVFEHFNVLIQVCRFFCVKKPLKEDFTHWPKPHYHTRRCRHLAKTRRQLIEKIVIPNSPPQVNGHKEYFRQMDEILRVIGVRTKKPMTRATSLQMAAGQAAPLKPTSFSASATFCATPEVASTEVEAATDCLAKADISGADQPQKPEKPTSTSSAPVEMFREEADIEFLEVEKMDEAKETAEEAKEGDEGEEEEELQMEEISATTSAVPASSEVLFQRRSSRPDPSRCSGAGNRRRRRLTR